MNDLILSNQSGFQRTDSCLNQLLSLMHEICQLVEDGLGVRDISLDISKVSA